VVDLCSPGQHSYFLIGLTTPLLFSNRAIEISPTRIKRLIDTFLRTCSNYFPGSASDIKWREEAQFSGPHELAMALRWGLARIVRISQGQETRGIISWETYLRWREDEGGTSPRFISCSRCLTTFPGALYPPQYFGAFLPSLPAEVQVLLTTLLSFLARLAAHATSSGLTPPALSSLFGPLLFGLGSPALPFHHTYGAYLRCSHATEHLLLAYIRAQDAATSRAVGMPSRLKDWIRGYPAMIPPIEKLDKARRGARTVRVTSVRRNVRLYSHDLVRTAASWAAKGEQGNLSSAKEWTRVMGPPNAKLVPRYSDSYRQHLDIPPNTVPDIGFDGTLSQSSSGSSSAGDDFGLLGKEDEKRFRSLTDLKWGEFESLGFGGGDEKRLEFDLNEGARTVSGGV
jgi:Meiotically up-regulated protein Msb1/Mug8 domain